MNESWELYIPTITRKKYNGCGFKKGHIPINKGVPHTEEQKAKLRAAWVKRKAEGRTNSTGRAVVAVGVKGNIMRACGSFELLQKMGYTDKREIRSLSGNVRHRARFGGMVNGWMIYYEDELTPEILEKYPAITKQQNERRIKKIDMLYITGRRKTKIKRTTKWNVL